MARKGGSGEDWMTTTAGLLLGWMGRRFGMGLSERERPRERMEGGWPLNESEKPSLSVPDDITFPVNIKGGNIWTVVFVDRSQRKEEGQYPHHSGGILRPRPLHWLSEMVTAIGKRQNS